jgi:hypothetical protein
MSPSSTSDVLSLVFDDGHRALAHAMWLRHNCPRYFSSSGQVQRLTAQANPARAFRLHSPLHCQRIVPITDIPAPPLSSLRRAAARADGSAVHVEFFDGHQTQFTAAWLRE